MRFTLFLLLAGGLALGQTGLRPMTFQDVVNTQAVLGGSVSPDGNWMLYALAVPDWKEAKRFTDIYLVSTKQGLASTRQMTFTKLKNEASPLWSRDGRFFVFSSDREGTGATPLSQLYLMRTDGGEAQRITDAKDGVGSFAFSKDGKWLAWLQGKADQKQIWVLPVAAIETAKPKQWTKHATQVDSFEFAPDSKRIYFLTPDSSDKDNLERMEKKFTVRIRNQETPLVHLWGLDVESGKENRITSSSEYTVSSLSLSDDSKWIGFRGTPAGRYQRTVNEAAIYADLYLVEAATGKIERLTNNKEMSESPLSFSPDSRWMAFSAANDFTYFRTHKVYARPVSMSPETSSEKWRKLGDNFDGEVSIDFWSADSTMIYFNTGVRASTQLMSLAVDSGKVTQVSSVKGTLSVRQDEDSNRLILSYSDPVTPRNFYAIGSAEEAAHRSSWKQLTDSNPQVKQMALGQTSTVEWKSSDGRMVEGILVKPADYAPGKKYPLIVQIHGGPRGASTLGFDASYGNYSNIYAGAGYICLQPNYRGSSNYGEKFATEIAGDYFRQGYEDIMTGVDHLIAQGLVDETKMGVMGWSAGGHWSNWILTHTDRFKAISSGAGAMNWTSMYAQNDTQRVREHYFGGLPYDNFDKWWNVSPLKYIKNAKTPTLIQVVDGDPRVPRPQSEELHMALKKLGVPAELLVYPGSTHGIPDVRNQMVKMVSEFHWFEKWVRGQSGWFEWKEMLSSLDEKREKAPTDQ
ncbi:MAG: S9 family peptidase [Acidobacteriia bacterium]|nr:S9 family peptidase [Terriglobia bacterium]